METCQKVLPNKNFKEESSMELDSPQFMMSIVFACNHENAVETFRSSSLPSRHVCTGLCYKCSWVSNKAEETHACFYSFGQKTHACNVKDFYSV